MNYRQQLYRDYHHFISGQSRNEAPSPGEMEGFESSFAGILPSCQEVRILDAGCGDGFLIQWLLSRGFQSVIGVDNSPDQIQFCKKRDLPVVQAEITRYLADNHDWDLIISTDVIEHLTKQEVMDFLNGALSALAPGGGLVVRTGNAASIYGPTLRYIDFTHETFYTEGSLTQVMEACGFVNVRISDVKVPFGLRPKRFLRWAGAKVLRAALRAAFTIEVGVDAPRLFGKFLIAWGEKPPLPKLSTETNG